MKIRQGWSGQVSANPDRWAKYDVTLEEEDLRRLLNRAIKDPRVLSDYLAHALTTGLAGLLLETEAEILVYRKLVASYGYPQADGKIKLDELTAKKQGFLNKIAEMSAG